MSSYQQLSCTASSWSDHRKGGRVKKKECAPIQEKKEYKRWMMLLCGTKSLRTTHTYTYTETPFINAWVTWDINRCSWYSIRVSYSFWIQVSCFLCCFCRTNKEHGGYIYIRKDNDMYVVDWWRVGKGKL